MRRTLIFVLMFMLSLQWSWGAAASMCAHEADVQTQHVGHHEHAHAHESADASSLSCHAGCGVCHGFGGAVGAGPRALPSIWCGPARFASYQAAVPDRTVGTLLRPPLPLASLTS